MKKPKGPAKGVRVSSPVPPGRAAGKQPARRRHHRPGKPHHQHHPGPGGVKAHSPLPGPGKPVRQGKQPGKPVKRKLAIAGGVACCAAEALAASLRLQGIPVGDENVLELYRHTAAGPDDGATIEATLEAAARFGLAGIRPEEIRIARLGEELPDQAPLPPGQLLGDVGHPDLGEVDHDLGSGPLAGRIHVPIVGVTLPGGPHALCIDPSGAVWSWGELHDLDPGVAIEEAWTVDWKV